MVNSRMTNYIIPTSADVPMIIGEFIEHPNNIGAFGSKGVGELPMDGPAAAVASALAQATGTDITWIPVLPEHLMSARSEASA